eukprot:860236-Rhodomonas_salina.3
MQKSALKGSRRRTWLTGINVDERRRCVCHDAKVLAAQIVERNLGTDHRRLTKRQDGSAQDAPCRPQHPQMTRNAPAFSPRSEQPAHCSLENGACESQLKQGRQPGLLGLTFYDLSIPSVGTLSPTLVRNDVAHTFSVLVPKLNTKPSGV